MIEVKFYDGAADDLLKFAVIIARQDGNKTGRQMDFLQA